MSEQASRRRVTVGANAALGLVLVLAIAAMVNYLAFRHYRTWDFTTSGIYTLSGESERIVRGIGADVTFYVFLAKGEPEHTQVRELLDRYRALSPRVKVRFVDPDRNPAEYASLAQRYALGVEDASGNTVADHDTVALVVSGEKKWTISRYDLLAPSAESMESDGPGKVDVKAEQSLTGALVQVTTGRATRICATQGHGEWNLEAGGARSLTWLKDTLARSNVELEPIETAGRERIGEDCDAIFVVGPQSPFTAAEGAGLLAYARRGGNLLLALDPILRGGTVQPTGLEDALSELGVRVGADVVLELDPARRVPQNPAELFLVGSYGGHETVAALTGVGAKVAMKLVRSVRPSNDGAEMLMETSAESFARADLSDYDAAEEPSRRAADLAGPVPIAAVVYKKPSGAAADDPDAPPGRAERGSRVIVVGDSDLLLAGFLESEAVANIYVASAWTAWLTEREAIVSIAPKKLEARAMRMTDEDLSSLLLRVVVLMPAAFLVLWLGVWWTRRS